jgi:hypothetical protein
MYELETLGFIRRKPQLKSEMRPRATTDGTPWEFVGGIQFDREATMLAPDGEAVLHLYLKRPDSVTRDPNEAYRTLVKRFPDGSIKYLLISFDELVE